MANTVTLKVKINDDGGLELIASKSTAAAKGLDKVDKAQTKASKSGAEQTKQNKGVAGATSNSTKAFSKMTTGITGGLVPAYAVLAANVFALTAAFGALQRAFGAELLEQGLIRVGNAAGQNLPAVAEGLKEITGAAVSLEVRMRSTALAFSSGFSTVQLESLASVAKGASVALGRDMSDALDRLVRGTAKLEPEILDELGIMVRLDDAVRDYASGLGTAEGSLTQFQRRQAFLNAAIEQGEKKFSDVAGAIDTNPYDKLSASFADLTKSGLTLVNNVLEPIIRFLASSPLALGASLALFGSTIVSSILPAIGSMATKQKALAKEAATAARKGSMVISEEYTKAAKKVSKELTLLPKGIQSLAPAIKKGTLTLKEQKKVLTSLKQSERIRITQAKFGSEAEIAQKNIALAKIREQIVATKALIKTEGSKMTLDAKGTRAKGTSTGSGLTGRGLKEIERATTLSGKFAAATKYSKLQMLNLGKTSGNIFTKIRVGATAARGAVTMFGTAFLSAIPIIGQVAMAVSLLYPLVEGLFGKGKMEKELESISKGFQSFGRIGHQLGETLKTLTTDTERYVATLKVNVGVMAQITDGYAKYDKALKADRVEKLIEAQRNLSIATLAQANGQKMYTHTTQTGVAMLNRYASAVEDAKLEVENLKKTLGTFDKDAATVLVEEAMLNISSSPTLMKTMSAELGALGGVLHLVTTGAIESGQDFKDVIAAIAKPNAVVLASITQAQQAMSGLNTEVNKLGAKASSPFDQLIEKTAKLHTEFKAAGDQGAIGFRAFEAEAKGLVKQVGVVRKVLPKITANMSNEQVIEQMGIQLIKNRDTIINTAGDVSKLQNEQKKLNGLTKDNASAATENLRLEKAIIDRKLESLKAETENFNLADLSEKQSARMQQIEIEKGALIASRKSEEEDILRVAVAQVQEDNKLLALGDKLNQQAKVALQHELKMADIAQKRREAETGKKTTASETFSRFKDEKGVKQEIINMEFASKINSINMEYALLDAQLALQKQRADDAGLETESYTKIAALMKTGKEGAIQAAGAAFTSSTASLGADGVSAERAALNEGRSAGGSMSDRIDAATGEGGALNAGSTLATIGDKVASAVNVMQPMMDLMGPEGALMGAVTAGAVASADAWSTAFTVINDKAATSGEKVAAGMQAASATLGAIGGILAQSSKDRISNIDNEIAAEKKRDGSSAASVAKIKKMEAKKEAMKKKAFETDKKVKMAQTIMNTAAGIMEFYADGNIPMAIATGIMGAIQLATIASTSYQGGGGGAPSGEVSAVSMGKRNNTVDLASGNNAGGELGYMRGESGTGKGMTDFKPGSAFTGAKYRASGGETAGFMVGEQGPEMFIPDRAGRIAPAGEVQAGRAPTNVNFNIQAVDAAGVEDVLIQQKGHIIRMIREAANEHGHNFLEGIAEEVYR